MKVGDYVKHGDCVFYLTEDVTLDQADYFEFKALLVYTTIIQPNEHCYVGNTKMKLMSPKDNPSELVVPIFITE